MRRRFVKTASVVIVCGLLVLLAYWGSRAVRERQRFGTASAPRLDEGWSVELETLRDASPEEVEREILRVASKLVAEQPSNPAALDVLAKAHFMLGNTADAIACWQRALQYDANFAEAYYGLGYVAAEKEDYEKAVRLFQEALQKSPGDFRIHPMLADAMMKLGRINEAAKLLESHIAGHPTSTPEVVTLGQAYLQLHEYEKARTVFEASARLSPEEKNTLYGLARAYAGLNMQEEARATMEKFRAVSDREGKRHTRKVRAFVDAENIRGFAADTYVRAGTIYAEVGEHVLAEELWRMAAYLAPKDQACRAKLADLYDKTGQEEKALRVCEQLCQIEPDNLDFRLNVALLNARLHRRDAALEELEYILQRDPENTVYRKSYEMVRDF